MAALAAASAVIAVGAQQVKFSKPFATGTPLRPANERLSRAAIAAPLQPPQKRLQVTALKKLLGKVVTDTNDKSVTVAVRRVSVHPKYKKRVSSTKNYIVHDPGNSAKKGDVVLLAKCAPVSKRKQFKVVEIKTAKQERSSSKEEVALPPFESAVAAA